MNTQDKFRAVVEARKAVGVETTVMIVRPSEWKELFQAEARPRLHGWRVHGEYLEVEVFCSVDNEGDHHLRTELAERGIAHYEVVVLCKADGWLKNVTGTIRVNDDQRREVRAGKDNGDKRLRDLMNKIVKQHLQELTDYHHERMAKEDKICHTERCVVCGGYGMLNRITDPYNIKKDPTPRSICNVCDGKGWVTVEKDDGGIVDYTKKVAQHAKGEALKQRIKEARKAKRKRLEKVFDRHAKCLKQATVDIAMEVE